MTSGHRKAEQVVILPRSRAQDRGISAQPHLYQLPVRRAFPEGDTSRACVSGGLDQDRRHFQIVVENRDTTRLQPCDDTGFLTRDTGQIVEGFQMRGGDRGDHHDMGPGQP